MLHCIATFQGNSSRHLILNTLQAQIISITTNCMELGNIQLSTRVSQQAEVISIMANCKDIMLGLHMFDSSTYTNIFVGFSVHTQELQSVYLRKHRRKCFEWSTYAVRIHHQNGAKLIPIWYAVYAFSTNPVPKRYQQCRFSTNAVRLQYA